MVKKNRENYLDKVGDIHTVGDVLKNHGWKSHGIFDNEEEIMDSSIIINFCNLDLLSKSYSHTKNCSLMVHVVKNVPEHYIILRLEFEQLIGKITHGTTFKDGQPRKKTDDIIFDTIVTNSLMTDIKEFSKSFEPQEDITLHENFIKSDKNVFYDYNHESMFRVPQNTQAHEQINVLDQRINDLTEKINDPAKQNNQFNKSEMEKILKDLVKDRKNIEKLIQSATYKVVNSKLKHYWNIINQFCAKYEELIYRVVIFYSHNRRSKFSKLVFRTDHILQGNLHYELKRLKQNLVELQQVYNEKGNYAYKRRKLDPLVETNLTNKLVKTCDRLENIYEQFRTEANKKSKCVANRAVMEYLDRLDVLFQKVCVIPLKPGGNKKIPSVSRYMGERFDRISKAVLSPEEYAKIEEEKRQRNLADMEKARKEVYSTYKLRENKRKK